MKNIFTSKPNTRVNAQLTVDTGTIQRTSGIQRVKMYQNFSTDTNQYMSINNVARESNNKKLVTTRTKITKINSIIDK